MANMSYCRFENTIPDLSDCLDALRNAGTLQDAQMGASGQEARAMRRLIKLCVTVAEEFEDDLKLDDYNPE